MKKPTKLVAARIIKRETPAQPLGFDKRFVKSQVKG
jgi:hypothetical protein